MNKIKFANAEVDAWKVKQGVVVSADNSYYHIGGFANNSVLNLVDNYNSEGIKVYCDEITWLNPH